MGVFYLCPSSLNIESPLPVWVASAVIGQVASRLLSGLLHTQEVTGSSPVSPILDREKLF